MNNCKVQWWCHKEWKDRLVAPAVSKFFANCNWWRKSNDLVTPSEREAAVLHVYGLGWRDMSDNYLLPLKHRNAVLVTLYQWWLVSYNWTQTHIETQWYSNTHTCTCRHTITEHTTHTAPLLLPQSCNFNKSRGPKGSGLTWDLRSVASSLVEVDPENPSLHQADARPLDPSTKLDPENVGAGAHRWWQLGKDPIHKTGKFQQRPLAL